MKFKKYKIKEKTWSVSNEYRIHDENDMEVFLVKGKAFSLRNHMYFLDSTGIEIFEIEQKLASLKTTFFILKEGRKVYKVIQELSLKPRILVESLIEAEAFEVLGNLWGNEYKFLRNDQEFAMVSRDIWKISGTYGVAVNENEDERIVLAVVIIINVISHMNAAA